jgi:hypothetical protein
METQTRKYGLMYRLMKGIKKIAGAGLLVGALALNANAQSIFNGLRGPTDFQLDDRISYSSKEAQNGKVTETTGNNAILKYWNGTNNGVFAYLNLPYKQVKSGENSSEGLGDIAFGIGPRLETKVGECNLGILSYFGASLPTGSTNLIPALGTGRTDYKAGIFGTLIDKSKKYEADFALDYNITQGREVSDEFSGGVVFGGRLNNNLRVVAGPLFNYKTNGENNGDYTLSGRVNVRWTPKGGIGKRMHFEFWYDGFLAGNGPSAPKVNSSATFVTRINF